MKDMTPMSLLQFGAPGPQASPAAGGGPALARVPELAAVSAAGAGGLPATGHQAVRRREIAEAVAADQRLATEGYLRTRTLTPFAIYCLVFGLGSIVYLELIR